EAGDAYERHADEVGKRVARGESVEALLDRFTASAAPGAGRAPARAGRVQRKLIGKDKDGKDVELKSVDALRLHVNMSKEEFDAKVNPAQRKIIQRGIIHSERIDITVDEKFAAINNIMSAIRTIKGQLPAEDPKNTTPARQQSSSNLPGTTSSSKTAANPTPREYQERYKNFSWKANDDENGHFEKWATAMLGGESKDTKDEKGNGSTKIQMNC